MARVAPERVVSPSLCHPLFTWTVERTPTMGRPRTDPEPLPRPCKGCGKEFTPIYKERNRQKYCTVACQRATFLPLGKIAALSLESRMKNREAQLANFSGEHKSYPKYLGRHQHRVVMEDKLGRPLAPGEIVHHDDENKSNNVPGNLELLGSQGDHCRLHFTKNRVCSIEGCGRKHHGNGLCNKHWRQWRKRCKQW